MPDEERIVMEQDEYMEYLRNQVKGDATPVAQLNLYQMNKDLVKGLKSMTNMEINKALEKVQAWFEPNFKYYALLNHEQHYFTIFHDCNYKNPNKTSEAFLRALKDILMNWYGDNDIRAIDVQEDGAVEIWGMWNGEPTVAYLFPYDQGVVDY